MGVQVPPRTQDSGIPAQQALRDPPGRPLTCAAPRSRSADGLFDRNPTLDVRRWVDIAPQKRHECGQRRANLARNAKSSARGPSVEAIPPGEGHTDSADDRLPAYPASSARAQEDAAELAATGGGVVRGDDLPPWHARVPL